MINKSYSAKRRYIVSLPHRQQVPENAWGKCVCGDFSSNSAKNHAHNIVLFPRKWGHRSRTPFNYVQHLALAFRLFAERRNYVTYLNDVRSLYTTPKNILLLYKTQKLLSENLSGNSIFLVVFCIFVLTFVWFNQK